MAIDATVLGVVDDGSCLSLIVAAEGDGLLADAKNCAPVRSQINNLQQRPDKLLIAPNLHQPPALAGRHSLASRASFPFDSDAR